MTKVGSGNQSPWFNPKYSHQAYLVVRAGGAGSKYFGVLYVSREEWVI